MSPVPDMAREQSSLYEILGVSPYADRSEILAAFEDLAKVYSPASRFYDEIVDRKPGETVVTENQQTFSRIVEAFKVLSDVNQRREYDASIGVKHSLRSWEDEGEATVSTKLLRQYDADGLDEPTGEFSQVADHSAPDSGYRRQSSFGLVGGEVGLRDSDDLHTVADLIRGGGRLSTFLFSPLGMLVAGSIGGAIIGLIIALAL